MPGDGRIVGLGYLCGRVIGCTSFRVLGSPFAVLAKHSPAALSTIHAFITLTRVSMRCAGGLLAAPISPRFTV